MDEQVLNHQTAATGLNEATSTETANSSSEALNEPSDESPSSSDIPPSVPKNITSHQVHPGMRVQFKKDESEWCDATVLSRAGRAKGIHKDWWNVRLKDGSTISIDLSPKTAWIELIPPEDNEHLHDISLTTSKKQKDLNAKLCELEQWRIKDVYNEVPDKGQNCISLRWVLKPKIVDGIEIIKARLCARGFEEDQSSFRTDSPTCSREGIRVGLALIASKGWKINSIDVKSAFLQGNNIERDIYVRPPKEAATDKLWHLKKCVYGLADASRYWYLRVRDEMIKLNIHPSELDQGIFYMKVQDSVMGIAILFVDDITWAGEVPFQEAVKKFESIFQIGSSNDTSFKYVGIQITQNPDMSISIEQDSYAQSLSPIPISAERLKSTNEPVDEEERSSIRSSIGKLNWLSNISRPEISFHVSSISSKIKTATVADMKEINKTIKFVQTTQNQILFPHLNLPNTRLVMFSDASYNNLKDGGSQGGHVVFLVDDQLQSCPLLWSSNRTKRVARSTLSAETLAFTDGCDSTHFLENLCLEALMTAPSKPILALTDSQSLFDASNTSTQVTDRRLRVEIASIRQMKEQSEIIVQWLSKDHQIADVLTKKGAPNNLLMSTIKNGNLNTHVSYLSH